MFEKKQITKLAPWTYGEEWLDSNAFSNLEEFLGELVEKSNVNFRELKKCCEILNRIQPQAESLEEAIKDLDEKSKDVNEKLNTVESKCEKFSNFHAVFKDFQKRIESLEKENDIQAGKIKEIGNETIDKLEAFKKVVWECNDLKKSFEPFKEIFDRVKLLEKEHNDRNQKICEIEKKFKSLLNEPNIKTKIIHEKQFDNIENFRKKEKKVEACENSENIDCCSRQKVFYLLPWIIVPVAFILGVLFAWRFFF